MNNLVYFRADASEKIGTGHVMRCLVLAEKLLESGMKVEFICRNLEGNLIDLIRSKNISINCLMEVGQNSDGNEEISWSWAEDANLIKRLIGDIKEIDWLIVDHYSFDIRWEQMLRPYTKKLMVIDDLANRKHDCDLLLDQNYYENLDRRYVDLVPSHCKTFLGPSFALLRPEFTEVRNSMRSRDGSIKRILVFFGGTDPSNETLKTLKALEMLDSLGINVDVVVGNANPHKEQIRNIAMRITKCTFHCQVSNIAQLMLAADLAIGGGGTTTWERCIAGLPTVMIVVAANQKEIADSMSLSSAAINLGESQYVTEDNILNAVQNLLLKPKLVHEMGLNAKKIVENRDAQDFAAIVQIILGGK